MSITLVPHLMKHFYNGSETSLYYLRQEAGSSQVVTQDDVAGEIQETSSLSKGDVVHVMSIFMSELRKVLVRGDRVKIAGLGTFFMTLSSKGVEKEELCDVRNVSINIRFRPDKALKLVNNAVAPTRSDNNVSFAIKGAAAATATPTPGGEGGDGGFVDPDA